MTRKKILVVEDNEDNRRILVYRLRKIGDFEIFEIFDLIGRFNRLIFDLQKRGQSGDQFIEFDRVTEVIEDRRQRATPIRTFPHFE